MLEWETLNALQLAELKHRSERSLLNFTRIWFELIQGERLLLEAPTGKVGIFAQQVAEDIRRLGLQGVLQQSLVLGVEVSTRSVLEIICVTRLA